MRVGDSYKIAAMCRTGSKDSEILERYKHDYPPAVIQSFIKAHRKDLKVKAPAEAVDEPEVEEEEVEEVAEPVKGRKQTTEG